MSAPKIITLSGPSASGKTTIQAQLLKKTGFAKVVTATTRIPREGEEEGVSYYFTDRDTFNDWKVSNELIESVEVSGNLYGTHIKGFMDNRDKGLSSVVVLDPVGVRAIQEYGIENGYDVLSVYVDASEKTLMGRLLGRLKSDNWQVDGALNVKVIDAYVQRVCHVLTKEKLWRYQAHYDIVVDGCGDLEESVDLIVKTTSELSGPVNRELDGSSVVPINRSLESLEKAVRRSVSRYLVLEQEEIQAVDDILSHNH